MLILPNFERSFSRKFSLKILRFQAIQHPVLVSLFSQTILKLPISLFAKHIYIPEGLAVWVDGGLKEVWVVSEALVLLEFSGVVDPKLDCYSLSPISMPLIFTAFFNHL